MPLSQAVEHARRARRRAPRLGRRRGRERLRRPQRGGVGGRRVRLRPARREGSTRRSLLDAIQAQAEHRAELARADRARGGRRGRGLGAVRSRRPPGLFNTVVELVVGQNAHLRFVCGQELDENSWSSARSAPASPATRTLDWVVARLRLGQRQGLPEHDPRRRGRGGEGHRRVRHARAPAPGLRHDAGARRGQLHLRPRVPRHPRRPLQRGLARDDQGRSAAPSRPTPSRSRATCCSARRPTPTRSRAWRSSPTTCAARTRPRSPRSTPTSSSTCVRAGWTRRSPRAWSSRASSPSWSSASRRAPMRDALATALERRLEAVLG